MTIDRDRFYHVNGEVVPTTDATVSVEDRGFRYGDGAFETMRAYGGSIFEWEAHADRLDQTCAVLALDHGLSRSTLLDRIHETLSANDLEDAYVRLSITRGVQSGTLTPKPVSDPTVIVYVKPLPRGGVTGTSVWDGQASLRTVETRRIPDESIPAAAKTHNYLQGILARQEFPDVDEVLVCDGDGVVAEGTTSNVFFVRDGTVHTPSLDGPVLPGITRDVVIDLVDESRDTIIDGPVRTGRYEPDVVRTADEVFLTNTTWEIRPVSTVDDRSISCGPITSHLSERFDAYVEATCY